MIVITGGAGFIGSNLVAGLAERDLSEIAVCDRLGSGEKWRNLGKRELAAVIAPPDLMGWLDGHRSQVRILFHLGAISATNETDSDLVVHQNFTLSQAIWSWCAEHEVRLVYASSAATYGDGSQGFDDVSDVAGLARFRPLNNYGWSKHLFDRRVARLIERQAPRPPQHVGLKFFNVYGPNEGHKGGMKSGVAHLWPRAAGGEPARLFRSHNPAYPDGGQRRDFVSVFDCVEIMLWLLDRPEISGLFNVGTGRARSWSELASAVYRAIGREPRYEFVDTPPELREHYQYFTEARIDRLREAGYDKPSRSLEDGVTEYVRGYLAATDPYR
jgi:ADP-L-glycero-D-manno-heptose 6-epimerase